MNKVKNVACKVSYGPQKQRERPWIRYKCALTNTIADVLRQRPAGWSQDDGEWDFYWSMCGWLRENFDRKKIMVKNLKRLRKPLERESRAMETEKCNFFPKTFELPAEYHLMVVAKMTREMKSLWENYVAQRYIENPYLIGAWLYRDGFARFSNTRFTLSKTAPDYDPDKGCKWMIQELRQFLTARHGPEQVETLFIDMDNIFITSLQSVQKIIINDKHCFELYGYDILLDEDLKP
ncbi:hypothetical protein GDO86_014651 [Hymenochirus boettgeri]|uniref:Tubulin--tyrosine ligase-like protein 9 n=1 Tax=Hymenochirus boettgeri TaxID=247094 RepID=A0A8T2JSH3_9PIPI|nr:hypothetical protein GDO86_014651 [Hymenochirus boettgeri]